MLRRAIPLWRTRASIADLTAVQQACSVQRRCFASVVDLEDIGRGALRHDHTPPKAIAKGQRRTGDAVYMGLVGTHSPKTTKIEDLVSQIKPGAVRASTQQSTYPSLLTVLTTPSYAKQALSSELPGAIARRFGDNPTASQPLDAIVAVVDRLPLPDGSAKGTEGLAYAFSPDRPGPYISSHVPLNESAQKPGALSFTLPAAANATSAESNDNVTTLQLPLAQTVFSNGFPSTLIHTRYHFDPLSGTLRMAASERLESQTLHLDVGIDTTKLGGSIPLIPLTPLREVQHSMGNIVQKVSSARFLNYSLRSKASSKHATGLDPEKHSVVPASQELEDAVSNYFKFVGIPPQPVQVWAVIVTPSALQRLGHRTDTKDVQKATDRLLTLAEEDVRKQWAPVGIDHDLSSAILQVITQGGRLCKVLSGGGGWGKKAGLLSLDPDVAYSTRDLRGETGWEFDFDGDDSFEAVQRQRNQALGEIVKEGDGVMFLLAPDDLQKNSPASRKSQTTSGRAVSFGVVPSSIDEYASSITGDGDAASATAKEPEHHPNFFGMLSEGGMAITVISPRGDTITQSKMDVPHQRVSILEEGGEDASLISDQSIAT